MSFTKVKQFLNSKYFLWLVVGLFALQALWIAVSFRYPLLFDEYAHVPIIEIYAENISPFISDQPEAYDRYGSVSMASGGNANLYHYIMSFPYRLVDLFINNMDTKVIILRTINIAMFSVGLLLFARLFRRVGLSYVHINAGLLFFTLMPLVPFVAAHVNYDNMLFPLSALFFILLVRIVEKDRVDVSAYLNLATLGMVASLVKSQFLPVFTAVFIFLVARLAYLYKIKKQKKPKLSFTKVKRSYLVASVTIMGLLIAVFSATYIKNLAVYHTPVPSCGRLLSVERCLANPVTRLYELRRDTKDSRDQLPAHEFLHGWYLVLVDGTTGAVGSPDGGPIVHNASPGQLRLLLYLGSIFVFAVIVFQWNKFSKYSSRYALVIVFMALSVSLLAMNYSGYLKYNMYAAVQSRYLLTVIPILLVFASKATSLALGQYHRIKIIVFVLLVALFTQGGGALTHIAYSEESWYFDNSPIAEVNSRLRKLANILIISD